MSTKIVWPDLYIAESTFSANFDITDQLAKYGEHFPAMCHRLCTY